jgi:hypothetical protein
VVNAKTADAVWPGQDPMGRLCRQGNDNHPLLEVIGVVGDTREVSLYKSPYLMAYVPYWSEETPASVAMVLKTDLPVDSVAPLARLAIHDVDPEIPVPLVQSFSQAIDRAVAPDRFQLMLVSGFAIAAMLLAALGVYGVPAFAVARRSQELGIRLALGAAPRSLVWLVIVQSLTPVLAGILIGFAGAVAAFCSRCSSRRPASSGARWSRSAQRSPASRWSPATSPRGASSASIPPSPFEESASSRA